MAGGREEADAEPGVDMGPPCPCDRANSQGGVRQKGSQATGWMRVCFGPATQHPPLNTQSFLGGGGGTGAGDVYVCVIF